MVVFTVAVPFCNVTQMRRTTDPRGYGPDSPQLNRAGRRTPSGDGCAFLPERRSARKALGCTGNNFALQL